MIKAIQAQFTDAIAHEAASRYGITHNQLQQLGEFESYIVGRRPLVDLDWLQFAPA